MDYGLIGEKLGHSFSKIIHESFAPYTYELCEVAKDKLDEFMTNRNFKAINVTIPYKQDVIKYLHYIDEPAKNIGAVNTIVNKDGLLYGYNTDFGGMKMLIQRNQFDFTNKKVLILGSGGTSKTAYAVATSLGASQIIKVSRSGDVNYDNVKELHSDASFIINTTPLGMYPNNDSCAINLDGFNHLLGVVDVVYNPLETVLRRQARKNNIPSCGGLYMLVAQAVLASEIFMDTKYDDNVFANAYNYVLSDKQNIVLTGMPGSGKSTIGKILSKKLNKELIDTDTVITARENTSIPNIFKTKGEKYFRDLESEVIKEYSQKNNLIIATGGGAVLREENIDNLKSNGKIFFLNRPLEQIEPTTDRPLSSDKSSLMKRYEERYPIYTKTSDVTIEIDGIISNTVAKILETLK